MKALAITLAAAALALGATAVPAVEFYVAPAGNDAHPGTPDRPFASLERARDALRTLRRSGAAPAAATIWVQPGLHSRTQTFVITAEDSGTEKHPVIYRAGAGGEVRLQVGRFLSAADFKPVTTPGISARLDAAARGKVMQAELATLDLKNVGPFPKVFNNGGGLFELFFDDQRMPLSRWPNEGFTTMGKVLDKGDWSRGASRHGGKFVAREDRVARWNAGRGVWLEGYWRVPWEPQTVQVKSISPDTREITFAEPVNAGIGSKYAKPGELGDGKEPWCAVNLLEEIDRPGEWCLDFPSRTLYFWPPGDLRTARVYVSDFRPPLVALTNVSSVTLRGLVLEGGLGNGVEISGGASNLVAGCIFRNLGGSGLLVRSGQGHGVRSSDFHDLGQSGIQLSGGDRKSLAPAGHFAENNHLYRLGLRQKTYAAAIHVGAYGGHDAVGCRVAHNLIHDLPHAAVLYGGNDHLFEFNEIARVAQTSGDVGAFYTWHDWTSRGNVVRHNFVHDSPRANAFYMDDGDSGDTIFGNVVYRCSYGPFIGGGHANVVRNNLVIQTERGLHLDARGVARGYATNQNLVRRLQSANPQQPPWSTRYPTLASLLSGRRDIPAGNLVELNLAVDCPTPFHFSARPDELAANTLRDNLALTAAEAGFINAEKLDFSLRPDSGVPKRLPAFKPIPFAQIGLVKDEYRLRLPTFNRLLPPGDTRGPAFDSNTDVQRTNRK
jgi:hypothetical protein